MKLFSFPAASLEKAIAKRMLTLEPGARHWFAERWAQKPYKKAFIDNKALPLVTLLAKGKTWDDETFDGELADWDVQFYAPEVDVLMPLIEGDGLLQLHLAVLRLRRQLHLGHAAVVRQHHQPAALARQILSRQNRNVPGPRIALVHLHSLLEHSPTANA